PIEAGNDTGLDRIQVTQDEYDWNSCGRRLGREDRNTAARCGDHGYPAFDQLGGKGRQAIVAVFRPAVLDREVAVLNIAGIAQAATEPGYQIGEEVGRLGV